MKSYGKLSLVFYLVLALISLAMIGFVGYQKGNIWIGVMTVIYLGFIVFICYVGYMNITINQHELTVSKPFRKEECVYFLNDIQVVTFDVFKDERNKKKQVMTILKKDKTRDVYELSNIFFEIRWLQKELSKYTDVL